METILYSRWEHGACEIKDLGGTYEIEVPDGDRLILASKKKLFEHIYGGRDLHIPFDRYFKLGKYGSKQLGEPILDPIDLFPMVRVEEAEIVIQDTLDHSQRKPKRNRRRGLHVETADLHVGPSLDLGIDLGKRGHEVEKLMYKGFGAEIHRSGYDPDDVLQEIYRGLLSRNEGRCPFDARKSSFSHYVYMVCRCVIRNIHRSESRRRNRESIGVKATGEAWPDMDAASCKSLLGQAGLNIGADWDTIEDFRRWIRCQPRGRTYEGRLASEIIPHIYQGLTVKEIAALKDLPPYRISRAIRYLKSLRDSWFN